MSKQHIVVHYHELWLKGGNRHFFLGRLITALRQSLEGLGVAKMHCPGDRILLELREDAPIEPVLVRLERVLGVAYFAVAREIPRDSARGDGVHEREMAAHLCRRVGRSRSHPISYFRRARQAQ